MKKILFHVTLFLYFFSYLKLVPNSMDTQPWFILASLITLCFLVFIARENKFIFARRTFLLWLTFLFFMIVITMESLLYNVPNDMIRGIASYLSLPLVFTVYYYAVQKKLISSKVIEYYLWVWLFFGFGCSLGLFSIF
jgi:hypothetical protein